MANVYIWGTGQKCENMINAGAFVMHEIAGFVETQKSTDQFKGKKVYSLDEFLRTESFEHLLVTVKKNDAIYELCSLYHIDLQKVCFVFPCISENNLQKNLKIAKDILTEKGYSSICENYGIPDIEWIREDAKTYEKLNTRDSFKIDNRNNFYISRDKFESAGTVNSYFWQDLWAAKKIFLNKPQEHFDIGSRVDGFIAHLLSFGTKVNLIDIRALNVDIENLKFTCSDATNLDEIDDNSIESLSALCSLEHFGLGRYGDPIDPEACFKCFEAINKKVKPDGNIYIAVPIGKEHIEFNAHRVFYPSTIVDNFRDCELLEFSVAKNNVYEENVDIHKYDNDASLGGARFGLFYFRKTGL